MACAEIVGLYPVDTAESCHLIELVIRDAYAQPDFSKFTQPIEGLDRADWQVPYDEKLLGSDVDAARLDASPGRGWPPRPAPRSRAAEGELFPDEINEHISLALPQRLLESEER